MSDHTRHLPQADLVTPAYVCDRCGKPANFLIWRYMLNLCKPCAVEWRMGVVWERTP